MTIRPALAALACAAVLPALTAGEADAALSCGKVVKKDLKLKADLLDCPGDGLVAGASGISIDLNGHTIDGQGAGDSRGVAVTSRIGVVVKGRGRIKDFDFGIAFVNANEGRARRLKTLNSETAAIHISGSDRVRIAKSRLLGSHFNGVNLNGASDAEITGNEIVGPDAVFGAATGVVVAGITSEANLVADNAIRGAVGTSWGVLVLNDAQDTKVKANELRGLSQHGVSVATGAFNTVVRQNRSINNEVYGFNLSAGAGAGTKVVDNVARRNGADGFRLEKAGARVGGNLAVGNDGWGMIATAAINDLGGNRAGGNGQGECSGASLSCG